MYAHACKSFRSRFLPSEHENEISVMVCEKWHHHPNFSTVPQRSMFSFSPSMHSLLSPQFSWTPRSPTTTCPWWTSVPSTPNTYDLLLKNRLFLCIFPYPVTLALQYSAWKLWLSAAMQYYAGENRLDIYRKLPVFSTNMYCLYLQLVSRYHFIMFFSCHYGQTQQLSMSNTAKALDPQQKCRFRAWILSKI